MMKWKFADILETANLRARRNKMWDLLVLEQPI